MNKKVSESLRRIKKLGMFGDIQEDILIIEKYLLGELDE